MATTLYIKACLALGFVISLIVLIAYLGKKFNLNQLLLTSRYNASRRIGLEETVYIDNKRKLLLIRRDDVSHLLLVGGEQDLVIEEGIKRC